MYNKVMLIGRLTERPQLTNMYARINLSIKEEFTNRSNITKVVITEHPVTFANKVAESLVNTCKGGDILLVEGKLVNNEYIKDGVIVKEYRTFGLSYKVIGHIPLGAVMTDQEHRDRNK